MNDLKSQVSENFYVVGSVELSGSMVWLKLSTPLPQISLKDYKCFNYVDVEDVSLRIDENVLIYNINHIDIDDKGEIYAIDSTGIPNIPKEFTSLRITYPDLTIDDAEKFLLGNYIFIQTPRLGWKVSFIIKFVLNFYNFKTSRKLRSVDGGSSHCKTDFVDVKGYFRKMKLLSHSSREPNFSDNPTVSVLSEMYDQQKLNTLYRNLTENEDENLHDEDN